MKAKPFNRLARAFSRQDWAALVLELVILILGITIAFQLDGWKDVRDREEVRAYYQANLLAETLNNLKEFDTLQAYRVQTIRSLDTLGFLLKKEGKEWDNPIRDHTRYLLRTSVPDVTTVQMDTYLTEFTGPEQVMLNTELLRLKALLQELKDTYANYRPRKKERFYDPLFGNMDDDLRVIDVEKVKTTNFRNGIAFMLIDERTISGLHFKIIEQLKRVRDLLQSDGEKAITVVNPKDSLSH